VRLAREVLPVFDERLEAAFPDRAAHVRSAVRDVRGGRMNVSDFGARMTGKGARWSAIEQLFTAQCRRLGLRSSESHPARTGTFWRPRRQLGLFDR
jgi:hypothetical protein